jgi:hypothetical protein
MERIVIEPSTHSPLIDFNPDGTLLMEGRSIPENVSRLFDPLIDFAKFLEVEKCTFNLNLEYFNTATSKKLLELFKNLDANNKIGEILINWHFEEGDEDSVEMAEIYEESLRRSKFQYHEHAEAEIN